MINNKEIKIELENNYVLIEFIDVTENPLIEFKDFRLVEVTFETNDPELGLNIKSLGLIAKQIETLLIENDCVVFYVCDNSEINRRDKSISPQQFRNDLFSVLFERYAPLEISKETVTIKDEKNQKQFVSGFAKASNINHLSKFIDEISSVSK